VTFRSGLGVNGTNAIDLVLSNCTTASVSAKLSAVPRVRFPFGAMEVRVRYKASSGWNGSLQIEFDAWDDEDDTSPTAIVFSGISTSGGTLVNNNTWRTWTKTVVISESFYTNLLTLKLAAYGSTGQSASTDYLRIDFVNVYPVATS
jgi:hypothetical protein